MLRTTLSFLLVLISVTVFGQHDTVSVTLSRSIGIALQNNLELQKAALKAETSKVNFEHTRAGALPFLNGRINAGINNGRSIDPYTNAYIDEQLSYSNAGLDLGATVFNGFRIRNSIQRDRYNLKAAEMETEEAKQDLILNVTLAYLQVLNNQDLVRLAKSRMKATSKQIDRLKELYELGVGNPAAYTDILGQYDNDRTQLVNAQYDLTEAVLNLSTLLNVDYPVRLEEQKIQMLPKKYAYTAEEVFVEALENLATFDARELRILAAEEAVNVSRSLYSPQISLFAQLNTNYSSAARLLHASGSSRTDTGNFVTVNGEDLPVFTDEILFSTEKIGFVDQFTNNLNTVVGVSVEIPLFNGFRARHNVNLQKIQLQESKLELESTRDLFWQAIKEAHAAMEVAFQEYTILQDQVASYSESYRVNEVRFRNGVSNFVEYIISKNNLDNSRIRLTNAKYEYLLRIQILEYFRGMQQAILVDSIID